MTTKVFLIGAGPGEEGLITVKGLGVLKNADVVIYDNLINHKILDYCRPDAEKIYVGKKINKHSLPQNKINALIIDKANENKLVVRLKGGDPFVFGRGGEEALELAKAKIPFEIVPGISSAVAALAYAGIPITHRDVSSSFHVITGHEDPTKESESVNYENLAKIDGTLVFLMGLNNLKKIVNQLLKYNKSPATPAAIISKGTQPEQKVVVGTLKNIEELSINIDYPAIIVIGEVVKLRKDLKWFENKPLFGKKILVTRSRHQASQLSKKIKELGAEAIEFPTIEIVPNSNNTELKSMYDTLIQYQWLIFTSVNSVEIFFSGLRQYNKDIRTLNNLKIAAIGKSTQEAIASYFINVDILPDEYVAECLIKSLKNEIKPNDKVLIPRSEVAREILPLELKKLGANVDVINLYTTRLPEHNKGELENVLSKVDIITFASSSTVKNFIEILGKNNTKLFKDKQTLCIGPITLNTALENGFSNIIMAQEYTIDGMIKSLISNFN